MVEKRTWVIVSLVLTFLSLIYIIMSYYGFIRYFSLHRYPMRDYVKNFKLLEKASKGRVVLSLTTTPKRIKNISAVINSLLDQTVRVDEIALNIPYKFQNKADEKYDIPKELEDVIHVYRCGRDYGPMTCLVPTLLREKEAGTKIIYLNDDVIYGKDFIEMIVDASNAKDGVGRAIFVKGWDTKMWPRKMDSKMYPIPNVICSKSGVLIQPEFFGTKVIEDVGLETDPDIWISGWLNKNKTPFHQISYSENYGDWGTRVSCRVHLTEAEKRRQIEFFV